MIEVSKFFDIAQNAEVCDVVGVEANTPKIKKYGAKYQGFIQN